MSFLFAKRFVDSNDLVEPIVTNGIASSRQVGWTNAVCCRLAFVEDASWGRDWLASSLVPVQSGRPCKWASPASSEGRLGAHTPHGIITSMMRSNTVQGKACPF